MFSPSITQCGASVNAKTVGDSWRSSGFSGEFAEEMQGEEENLQILEWWRSTRRAFSLGAGLGVVTFLLPLAALGTQGEPVAVLPPEPTPVASPVQTQSWDGQQQLRVLQADGAVEEMALSDYLWRVVAAEMPASFQPQALRAQAVCARTYSLWKMAAGSHGEDGADLCTDSSCCQAYLSPEQAAEKWGEQAASYGDKISGAVADTDGQVLTYDGAPIQAVFFSSSTASTEDAAQVWGNSLPYLVPVSSPEGEEVPNYHSTVTLTLEQVRQRVEEHYPDADLSGDPSSWITGVEYNASGRVSSLTVGGVDMSGGAARSLFGLRSACFQVEQGEEGVTFSVTGYGHGVGMSQYGANAMAAQGSDWRDIVTHYYTGVQVEDWTGREV